MVAKHEVIYGGLGGGKSTYAFKVIEPADTFKLGVGNGIRDLMLLKLGSKKRHEKETKAMGVESKTTTIDSVVGDVLRIEHPILLLDEWTTFFHYSFWWSNNRIIDRATEILDAVESNGNLQRGVYIALDHVPYMPFNIYKKKALWNKLLFERANKITRLDYGQPLRIL